VTARRRPFLARVAEGEGRRGNPREDRDEVEHDSG
jgi:hypothetical protein